MQRIYLLLLFLALPIVLRAQQSYVLKPYSITLPRVNTSQQSNPAIVQQTAGNIVYNTEKQALAINTGNQWQYLSTGVEFKNTQVFSTTATSSSGRSGNYIWTIPAGITQFQVEMWGGGSGGGTYTHGTNTKQCIMGGVAGGYVRKYVNVVAGVTSVSISVGGAGTGISVGLVSDPTGWGTVNDRNASPGIDSYIIYNGQTVRAYGGLVTEPRSGSDGMTGPAAFMMKGGEPGGLLFSSQQGSSTEFYDVVTTSPGGRAYNTLIEGGSGMTLRYKSGLDFPNLILTSPGNQGSFPGGGGGCGYNYIRHDYYGYSDKGGSGLVIIRW